ncbi:MAG: right-handed parallel beta-helix repeat-containing protein [Syntrophobacteraceae bacterium]
MKRLVLFTMVFTALVGFSPVSTNADFYVIPIPAGVGTRIAGLPHTITTPGYYYLAGNLTSTGSGITIETDNVTIDLCGFSLTGAGSSSSGYGIYFSGRKNIEIRNGTVKEFGSHGIFGTGAASRNNKVLGVNLRENGGVGMYLDGRGHLVQDCTAYLNEGTGIHASYCSRIQGCSSIQNTEYGFGAFDGCTISGNTAAYNGYYGIGAGNGNVISGNTSSNNTMHGISAVGRGNTITGNTAQDNEMLGLNAAIGNTVIGNTVYSNGTTGIQVNSGCTVKNNTSSYNQQNGIDLAPNCLVDGNTAYNNNQSAGSYAEIKYADCTDCRFGVNSPAP